MDYNETEKVVMWTKIKRGRLTALASALGFDRRTFHDRLTYYKTVSLDVDAVRLQQEIIEDREEKSKELLSFLKIWLQQRATRKKSLAEALQASNATVTKWLNADAEDTCLIGWIERIKNALPVIEQNERENYGENRRIANRLVKKYNAEHRHSIVELMGLAKSLLQFSNVAERSATVFFTKGKIVAVGWTINSLSKNYSTADEISIQGGRTVSSIEVCNQVIENKHKIIDTVICVGQLNVKDIALLEKANPRVIFHEIENEKVISALKDKNITLCKL